MMVQLAYATQYTIDQDEINGKSNTLLNSVSDRISMIIPALFLIITIIFFMLDFGTIGVVLGSMFGLGICVLIGLVALNGFVLLAYIVMGGLLIFKMGQ